MLIYNLFNVILIAATLTINVEKLIKIQLVVQFVQHCFNVAVKLTINVEESIQI